MSDLVLAILAIIYVGVVLIFVWVDPLKWGDDE